jgi:hypothetical protein
LTWHGSDYAWTNKATNTDTQDLSISGNVISLVNGGSVDLTTALSGAGGGIDNAGVDAHLNRSQASTNQVLSWNGSDYAWVNDGDSQALSWNSSNKQLSITNGNMVTLSSLEQTLSVSANILTISGSSSTVDLGKTQFLYANQNDFPNASTYHCVQSTWHRRHVSVQ